MTTCLADKLARRVHRDFGRDECDAVLAALCEFVAERPEHAHEVLRFLGYEAIHDGADMAADGSCGACDGMWWTAQCCETYSNAGACCGRPEQVP